jgi:hypothetical protein
MIAFLKKTLLSHSAKSTPFHGKVRTLISAFKYLQALSYDELP